MKSIPSAHVSFRFVVISEFEMNCWMAETLPSPQYELHVKWKCCSFSWKDFRVSSSGKNHSIVGISTRRCTVGVSGKSYRLNRCADRRGEGAGERTKRINGRVDMWGVEILRWRLMFGWINCMNDMGCIWIVDISVKYRTIMWHKMRGNL